MGDWTTGQADAFFWVVKLFIDTFGSGKKTVVRTLVDDTSSDRLVRGLHPDKWACIHSLSSKAIDEGLVAHVYAQAMVLNTAAQGDTRVVLLANTRNMSANVTVKQAAGGLARFVDMN